MTQLLRLLSLGFIMALLGYVAVVAFQAHEWAIAGAFGVGLLLTVLLFADVLEQWP